MLNKTKDIIFIVGPTAVGKTDVAFELAKIVDGEVVSADSMQVYRGMDVATSKPSKEMRQKIKHHLIDITEPEAEYSAADFKDKAESVIRTMTMSGKVPIVAGGSGFYVRSLIDGLFPGPGADWALRQRMQEEADLYGVQKLHDQLKEVDPEAASDIQPNDLRRIIRSLEVYYLTKEKISKLRKNTTGISSKYNIYIFGLTRDRAELYKAIDDRVDKMFDNGLVQEAMTLTNRNLSRSALQALGYKEVFGYLRGDYSLDEAKKILKQNTRRFAKRQLTWFRKDKRIQWLDITKDQSPKETAEKIEKLWKERS